MAPRPSNIEVEDQPLSVLLYLPTQNPEKKLRRNRLPLPAGSQIYRGLKEDDQITCKSNVHVVASLVDPRHVTRSLPIGKRI